jgi:hypothetical protein
MALGRRKIRLFRGYGFRTRACGAFRNDTQPPSARCIQLTTGIAGSTQPSPAIT